MTAVDLTPFCAINDARLYLCEPMRIGDFAVACNGHLAVFVPADSTHAGLKQQDKALETQLLGYLHRAREMLDAAGDAAIKASAMVLPPEQKCTDCDGSGRISTIDCDECDGEGHFWHGTHEYECTECNGEGHTSVAEPEGEKCDTCHGTGFFCGWWESVEWPGAPKLGIHTRYMRLIQTLPDCVMAADTGDPSLIGFRFTGGHGVVMPMRT